MTRGKTRKKARAILLAALVVMSVFGGTVAFTGTALAGNDAVTLHDGAQGTEISTAGNEATVYVRVADSGATANSESVTISSSSESVSVNVYDDGTNADDTGDDGTYWGSFTITSASTNDETDTLSVADGNDATVTADLDGDQSGDIASVTADYSVAVTGLSVANPSNQDVKVTIEAGEQLSSLSVDVSGAETGTLSGIGSDFTETDNGDGTFTYTATYTGSSDGDYTATLASASDNIGNAHSSPSDYSDTVTVDTTAPTISTVSLSNDGNGNVALSFQSDEQLGTSDADATVTVTGPNSATYTFDRGQLAETDNGDGSFTYELTATQAYDDSDGQYTAEVTDAKDAHGNNGGGSGLTDTYTLDTTVEVVNLAAANPSNQDVKVTIEANEQLSSLSVDVSGAETGTLSGIGSDFTETDNGDGTFTYTATYTGSSEGDYTATLTSASDTNENAHSSPSDHSDTVTVDTTAPVIWGKTLTNDGSDNIAFSFNSNEPLGTSASDATVTVTGPNGATYTFDRSQFDEGPNGHGGYLYTLTATQAFTDGDGQYTAEVTDAKDAHGNNGGTNGAGSDLTDTYTLDTTGPTISAVSLSNDGAGNVVLSFDSNEPLGTSASDATVTVTGPNSATYTFDRGQLAETDNGDGTFTYELTATQAYDDGEGQYTAEVTDAKDAHGNNGGTNGVGSGLTGTYGHDVKDPKLENAWIHTADSSGTEVKVTFNEPVDLASISASEVEIGGTAVDSIVAGNVDGTTSLTVKVNDELQTGTKPKVAVTGSYTETTGDTPISGETVVHTARLDLSAGMNFVSVPAASGSLDLEEIDSSNIDTIITYEKSAFGDNWKFHSFDGDSKNDDFDRLEGGQGYIFVMNSDDTIDVNVDNVPSSITPGEQRLSEGWNLVGHWQEGSQDATQALSSLNSGSIDNTVHQVYKQSDGATDFTYTAVDYSSSATDEMQPGEGYWIFVKDDEMYTEAGYVATTS